MSGVAIWSGNTFKVDGAIASDGAIAATLEREDGVPIGAFELRSVGDALIGIYSVGDQPTKIAQVVSVADVLAARTAAVPAEASETRRAAREERVELRKQQAAAATATEAGGQAR